MIAGFIQYIACLCFTLWTSIGENKEYRHPIYIAVAEIDYNNSDQFATVICKTFSDDLYLALQKKYRTISKTGEPEDVKESSSQIEDYVKSHLRLKINGKMVNFVLTNFKKEDNTVLAYFRINNISGIQTFEITDTIFYELYDKQIQLVYITVNGNRKSNRLVNPDSKVAFNF